MPAMKLLFPFCRGPSTITLPVIGLIPPLALNCSLSPSLAVMSKIEASLPPNLAGILLFDREKSLIASELKAEKKPNR